MPTKKARKALDATIDYLNGDEFVGLSDEDEAEVRKTMKGLWKALSARMGKGCDCFGCGKHMAIDRRPLNSTMVKGLLWLFGQHKKHGPKFIHMPTAAKKSDLLSTNQHSTLRHWGLIETHKRSGFFRISGLGRAFCEGRERVPAWVDIYDKRCLQQADEMVSITDVSQGGKKEHHFSVEDILVDVAMTDEVLDLLEEFDEE